MGLKTLLFKPRWQNKSSEIRAVAVARGTEPELLKKLSDIARTDPDATVRLAAARRVEHLDTLLAIATLDNDSAVSDFAWRQVMHQLQTLPDSEPAAAALAVLDQITDQQKIDHLAVAAGTVSIRRAAQDRVQREGLLGDIAIDDPEPELRAQAASRVSNESTLKRIADRLRKKDKKLYRAVRERLDSQQVAEGDVTAIAGQAEQLCQQMEQLAGGELGRKERAAEINRLTQAWDSLHRHATLAAALKLRFDGANAIARATLADPADDPLAPLRAELSAFQAGARQVIKGPDAEALQSHMDTAAALAQRLGDAPPDMQQAFDDILGTMAARRDELVAASRPNPALEKLCQQAEKPGRRGQRADVVSRLRASWQSAAGSGGALNEADQALKQRFDSALKKLAEQQERASKKRQEAAKALPRDLQDLETTLEAGDLRGAARALNRAQDRFNQSDKSPSDSTKLTELRTKFQEMRRWQRWSNDEIRQRLIDQAQAIPGAGLHPDALAAKVKELRGRWKDLDASEKLPGSKDSRPHSPKLFRAFQQALETAYEPARPFFEKRAEVRGKHLEALNEVVARMETVKPTGNNWDEVSKAVAEARGSLRRLGEVPHKERDGLARQLRAQADRLDEALKGQYEVVERRKQRIIDEVKALMAEPDLKVAIDQAKAAQQRWKAAGRLPRGRDQKLWKTYRAAADQVFGRLDEQRQAARAEQAAGREALKTLIDEARQLDPADPDFGRQLDQLHQRWREAGASDRRSSETFNQVIADKESAAQALKHQQIMHHRQELRDLADLCHQLEQHSDGDSDRLEALTTALETRSDMPEGLAQRIQLLLGSDGSSASGNDPDSQARLTALEAMCIEAEFLAGIESPEAFREARMAYQVQRLSRHMGGGATRSQDDEIDDLEQRWLACGPLPSGEQTEPARQRFLTALRALDQAGSGSSSG